MSVNSGQTTWTGGSSAETVRGELCWAARGGLVAAVLFAYVAVRAVAYWADHGHNALAGILAVAGAAGILLSLVAAFGLYALRHAAYWADVAMWNVRRRG